MALRRDVRASLNHRRLAQHRAAAGGDAFVANDFNSVWRSKGSLCDFGPLPFFTTAGRCDGASCIVQDVARAWDGDQSVLAVTVNAGHDGGVSNLFWHSTDAGDSWTELPDGFPGNLAASTLAVAPSDPNQLYVGGFPVADSSTCVAVSSSDGGATWTTATSIDASGSTAYIGPPVLRIMGIHPTNPKMAFFRLDFTDQTPAIGLDQLYASFDAGKTLKLIFQAKGDLSGFAFSPDATSLFIGGSTDGLLRANVADLETKGAAAFQVVNTDPMWGLAWTPNGLLAGHDDFGAITSARYSLGLSTDEGVTFTPQLVICNVGLETCAQGTSGGSCGSYFYGYSNFQQDFILNAGRCPSRDAGTGDAAAPGDAGSTRVVRDGGTSDAEKLPSKGSSGCGCTVPRETNRPGDTALSVLALLGTFFRRRHRNHARSRTRALVS